ncbi:MAG: GNAT family N-acetyltransferase [Rhodoferax sp.]|nr:GNAT family N-acetyltransferase [Rhodoferax sp.]
MMQITPLCTDAQEQDCADLLAHSDPWLTLGFGREQLLRTVRLPDRERYVAYVGEQLAGLLLLNLQGTFAGYIQTIGVAADFRGQGGGAELMGFCEKRIFRAHPQVVRGVSGVKAAAPRV